MDAAGGSSLEGFCKQAVVWGAFLQNSYQGGGSNQ